MTTLRAGKYLSPKNDCYSEFELFVQKSGCWVRAKDAGDGHMVQWGVSASWLRYAEEEEAAGRFIYVGP